MHSALDAGYSKHFYKESRLRVAVTKASLQRLLCSRLIKLFGEPKLDRILDEIMDLDGDSALIVREVRWEALDQRADYCRHFLLEERVNDLAGIVVDSGTTVHGALTAMIIVLCVLSAFVFQPFIALDLLVVGLLRLARPKLLEVYLVIPLLRHFQFVFLLLSFALGAHNFRTLQCHDRVHDPSIFV